MLSLIGKRVFQGVQNMIRNVGNENACGNSTKNSTNELMAPVPALSRIVWLDLEMTGLNIETDKIMEIACSVTDYELRLVAECPTIIVHQPDDVLLKMDDWCTKTHGANGLSEACRRSTTSITQAEDMLLEFLQQHVMPKMAPLAGNSIYMDKIFIMKHMPRIDQFLHYRILDVSTVKELCRNWNFEIFSNQPKKNFAHRAANDILESIEELSYYKRHFLKIQDHPKYYKTHNRNDS